MARRAPLVNPSECVSGKSSTETVVRFKELVRRTCSANCKNSFQLAVDNWQSAGQLDAMESRSRWVRQVRDENYRDWSHRGNSERKVDSFISQVILMS